MPRQRRAVAVRPARWRGTRLLRVLCCALGVRGAAQMHVGPAQREWRAFQRISARRVLGDLGRDALRAAAASFSFKTLRKR